MKIARETLGAQIRRVDSLARYARFQKLPPVFRGQIDVHPVVTGYGAQAMGPRHEALKYHRHLWPHLEAAFADSWPDGRMQIARIRAKPLAHRLQRALRNAGRCPTPPCVDGGYRAAPLIDKQNRDAISGPDGDHRARCIFQQGIAFADQPGAAARGQAGVGMNLFQCGKIGELARNIGVPRTESMEKPRKSVELLYAIDFGCSFIEGHLIEA